MKNLILTLICFCAISLPASYAASPVFFKKGNIVVLPSLSNLGINSITISQGGTSQSLSRIGLQASGGYVVKDNVIITGGVGFQTYKDDDSSVSLVDISAGTRYYFTPNIYAIGNLLYLSGTQKEKSTDGTGGGESTARIKSTGLRLGAGYSYFLNNKFAIEPSITYDLGIDSDFRGRDIDFGILSINIGFIVKI